MKADNVSTASSRLATGITVLIEVQIHPMTLLVGHQLGINFELLMRFNDPIAAGSRIQVESSSAVGPHKTPQAGVRTKDRNEYAPR